MSVDQILSEASSVLHAATRYSAQLSEVNSIDENLHKMRVLITKVAAHNYTDLNKHPNITAEVAELENLKNLLIKTASQRFANSNNILSEFSYGNR